MPHAVAGSQLYTATEIVNRTLRMIGAYAISDSGAQPEDQYEAMWWLDMMMAHEAGIGPRLWLMQDELTVALAAATANYVLASSLAQQLKTGVQFPTAAAIQNSGGQRENIPIITQKEFRAACSPAQTGTPTRVFIDRLNDPTLHVFPIPTASDVGSSIVLTVQTFADSVKPKGISANLGLGNEAMKFRAAWNLWAVVQLAAHIGNGPVRALPAQRISMYQGQATKLHDELLAFENRESDSTAPIIHASVYV